MPDARFRMPGARGLAPDPAPAVRTAAGADPSPAVPTPAGAVPRAGRPFPTLADLQPLLRPRGIAVAGASADAAKFSGRLIPALVASGYAGGLYPVNPRYAEIGGRRCYPDVGAVPDPCDLVLVAVPAARVAGVVEAAAARGLGAAIVLSAGFGEIGGEGPRRAAALEALASRIRIYGPNCPGLWQVADGLVYTFSAQFDPAGLRAGPIGAVTQGGALGRAMLDGMQAGLGFSYWFSTGNEADLDLSDFVALLADEPRTRVVTVLAEGFRDGRRFLAAAERCRAAGKPVVVLKMGRSAAGQAAARGHTASPAGKAALAAAALQAAGCIQTADVDELCDMAGLLARHPLPGPGDGRTPAAAPGPPGGLGICTFSGGAGVLLADLAADAGAPLPPLHPRTRAALRALLPEIATVGNPTDLTTAVLEDPSLARRALEIMAADPRLGFLLFPLPHRLDRFDLAMARHLGEVAAAAPKPIGVVAFSPVFDREEAAAALRDAGVPVFGSARRAVLAATRWLCAATASRLDGRAPGWSRGPVPRALRCTAFEDPVFGPALRLAPAGWGRGDPGAGYALAPLDPPAALRLLRGLPWVGAWRRRGGDVAGLTALLIEMGLRAGRGEASGGPVDAWFRAPRGGGPEPPPRPQASVRRVPKPRPAP